jgi:hypothetical protein
VSVGACKIAQFVLPLQGLLNSMRKLLLFALVFTSTLTFAQVDTTKKDTTNIPIINLSVDDQDGQDQNQDISGLLQSSRDVFASNAGFNFSAARFRMRGYGSNQFQVMVQGVDLVDPEMGFGIWSYWGGLNDMTRYPETKTGIASSQWGFGSVAGSTNISFRASDKRKGSRISYARTNRNYNNRVMASYNTGWLENGWAFSFSGSGRWSNEGYVEGSYYSGAAYFMAAEKKINDKHSVNFVAWGSPTVQGRAGIAVQEALDLTGNNYYNPWWGYQTTEDGQSQVKRNARIRNNHKPYFMVTDYLEIKKGTKLYTTAYFSYGRTSNSNLNWYNAPDPRPDYYRYLPSYYEGEDEVRYNQLTDAWMNDPSTSQIDWDALYFSNSKNLYTAENVDGIEGNDVTGNRSRYILEEYRTDPLQTGIDLNFYDELNDRLILAAGLNIEKYKSNNFRLMNDLLGGDFWIDVDQFAENESSDPSVAYNDINAPNRLIKEGDKFGYEYEIHRNKAKSFGQLDYKGRKIDAYGAATLGYVQFYRVGKYQNGRFPDNSLGKSDPNNFLTFGIKGGATYKITGRHFIDANLQYEQKDPIIRNAFISPRTRDYVVDGLKNVEVISGDISYITRYPRLSGRITAFYTEINDQNWLRSFYHEEFRTFVNYSMTDVDNLYFGYETGWDVKATSTISVQLAASQGMYLYNSRPNVTITRDNSNEVIAEDRTVYFQNYRVGGMPQSVGTIGLKYYSPKYWFVGVNANYFGDIYLDPNPDRRTEEAISGFVESDPQWREIIEQTKLEDGFTMNLFAGYSHMIEYGKYLRFNISVTNLLNNTDFRTGGFEQLRFDPQDIQRFPNRYGYMYGTQFFAMLTYQF